MAMHTVPEDLVADFAAGATTPGVSLLIAAHLTQAPEARTHVDAYEAVGGELLRAEEGSRVSDGALEATLAMLDGQDAAPTPAANKDEGPLPQIVLDSIGVPFDQIAWKFQLPGVAAYDLDGFDGEKVRILRARPGAKVPQHTHEGSELTLVMAGCLTDGGIEYRRGDVAVNDEHDDHQPQITGDETCYCLIVQQGGLRFTGRFSRVLNYLGE